MQVEMTDKERRWVDALQEVDAVMAEAGIPYFLDTGTLLGTVRDKRFIPWDNDIDLGILKTPGIEAKLARMSQALHAKGFSYFRSVKAAYFIKSPDVEIGMMFYDSEGEFYVNEFRRANYKYGRLSELYFLIKAMRAGYIVDYGGYSIGKKLRRWLIKIAGAKRFRKEKQYSRMFDLQIKEIRIPKKFFDTLKPLSLYGSSYLAPYPPEDYLEMRYGKWNIPVSDYDYFEDDRSVQGT